MSEEEQKYFKGLIGFTFDSDDIKYIEKIIDKKGKEIERLTELCNKYEEEHKTAFEEWKKTINIIKEVREYITSYINQFNGVYPPVDMRYLDLNKILEILDKENI